MSISFAFVLIQDTFTVLLFVSGYTSTTSVMMLCVLYIPLLWWDCARQFTLQIDKLRGKEWDSISTSSKSHNSCWKGFFIPIYTCILFAILSRKMSFLVSQPVKTKIPKSGLTLRRRLQLYATAMFAKVRKDCTWFLLGIILCVNKNVFIAVNV